MSEVDKVLLQERFERHGKGLFKTFLHILEDLQEDHQRNFSKLKKHLPENFHNIIDQANYFDQDKMQYLRKKVLDAGNESIRNQNEDFDKFTVIFDFKK